jgi:hypothetical protein
MSGPLNVSTENWGLIVRNGAGADNVQPQSGVGSAYVNDVYIRSIGKWASQLGSSSTTFFGIGTFDGACYWGNPITGNCSCPPGTRFIQQTGMLFMYHEWDITSIACIP